MNKKNQTDQRPGPLDGVRVVEYGVFHAGPGATAILADLGAEVIKIEAGSGDPERSWLQLGKLDISLDHGESAMFEASNRGKKGIWLDIKKDKGREVFQRLIKEADVFLTNIRKSTKAKLGLDYESVSKINPKIILANVSGFGPEGPLADAGAYDPLGMARSGMALVTGAPEPKLMHVAVLDQTAAISASYAIITALLVRERQGIGQEVHVSLLGTGLWMTFANLFMHALKSINPTQAGERRFHSPLRNSFCCRDGKWILGTNHPDEKYWPTFCEATGQTGLMADPRFITSQDRVTNCPQLLDIFDQVMATKTRDEWVEILIRHGLMYHPVMELNEIKNDPQVLANEYIVPFSHPRLGEIMIPGFPIHFSANSAGTRTAAPTLGQHTDEVLRQHGYSASEIVELRNEGIVK